MMSRYQQRVKCCNGREEDQIGASFGSSVLRMEKIGIQDFAQRSGSAETLDTVLVKRVPNLGK